MAATSDEFDALKQEHIELKKMVESLTGELNALKFKMEEESDSSESSEDSEAKEERERIQKKNYNQLNKIRKSLRQGILEKKMYEYLKTECSTKRTQDNVVKAYREYCAVHDKECDDGLTFAGMLEEMKAVLKL
jgi:hypothetical protein